MLLDEIGQHLDNVNIATFSIDGDSTIFIGRYPDFPDVCVTLYDTGGPRRSGNLPYIVQTFRVLNRGTDIESAADLAESIYDALDGLHHFTLPEGTWVLNCHAAHFPISEGTDEKGRYFYAGNYVIETRRITDYRG